MVVPIILASLGALLLAWFLYEKSKAYSLKATFIKTGASFLFVSLAAYGFYQSNFRIFPMFAVIGLILGMLGDIFLELKCVFKEKDYEFTLSGFIVFGLGHLFYITGMFLEFYHDQSVLYIIIPIACALLMGPVSFLVEKIFHLNYGEFKWVAFCYAIMLFGLAYCSFSVWMMNGFNNPGLLLLFIGGILFVASDMILNPTYFGKGHEKPFDFIINGITYYSAQYVIAFSILFI